MLRLCARTPRYYTRHGALFARNVHLPLPYPVEGGLGDFLPPAALKVVAVDYQGTLIQRLNDETRRTEYAGKGIVDTVLYASRAAGLVETDSYDPAVYPFEVVEKDPEEVDVREPDHVSLSKWSILVLNNHFFLSNLKPLQDKARNHQDKIDHALLSRINEDYGSLGQLKSSLSAASLGVFSGGHVWLVANHKGHLAVVPTFGRGSALIRGRRYIGPPMNDPSDPVPRPLARSTWQNLEKGYAAEMQELQSLLKDKPLPPDVASQFSDVAQLFADAPRLLALRDAWIFAHPEWRIKIEDVAKMLKEEENGFVDDMDEDDTSAMTAPRSATVDVYDEIKKIQHKNVAPTRDNLRFMDPLKRERLLQVENLIKAVQATVFETEPPSPLHSSNSKPLGAPREFHTSASRSILGPNLLLEKFKSNPQTPYDTTLNADNTEEEDDAEYLADDDAVVWPLFCVPVHEHAWLSAGYGVWGQEQWMQKFWNVLDWEKVSARYQQVMAEDDPAYEIEEDEDDDLDEKVARIMQHPAFPEHLVGPIKAMANLDPEMEKEIERELANMTAEELEEAQEDMEDELEEDP
ncbi:hypothetical protein CPB85DRAFT_1444108 [Mucidula mucida]|nr:hypothetical protein CPB85DRAFT_1444108 [Mucidula mucida]